MASEIWYSFQGGISEDDGIGFYDKTKFPWVKILEENWTVIAQEVSDFITENHDTIKPYFNKELVSKTKSWKTFSFKVWGWNISKNQKKCPKITKILTKIPGLTSASVSILQPHTNIKPHRGDTNAIMRSHLALKVPQSLPECGMRVKYEDRSWEEGKMLVFNDSAWHTAWNHSEEVRYVLIVDVIRPEFRKKKIEVCSIVLANLIMQLLMKTMGFIHYFPPFIKRIMRGTLAGPINIGLRIQAIMN